MVALFLLRSTCFGQTAAPAISGTGAVQYRILDQHRIFFGQHSVTLNFVAPPVFPAPVPTPTPIPVNPALNSVPAIKSDQSLFFGATVYDHQFTVIQNFNRDGGFVAVSNVDFDYFEIFGFTIGDTFYDIFMALDDESSQNVDSVTSGWLAQARAALSGTNLNALHTYFAENGTALVQQYQQEQAANAARALQRKLHPPVRPNTVINYWPIKSSVYLPGAAQ
jgi:hypothetical protein